MMSNSMIVDPWNPKPEEIREWAYSNEPWPDQDWDIAINNNNNDLLLIELASDKACPNRDFFIHCIYFMVGDAMHFTANHKRRNGLLKMLRAIEEFDDELIQKWKAEATELLTGQRNFEYDYWCGHMFNQ